MEKTVNQPVRREDRTVRTGPDRYQSIGERLGQRIHKLPGKSL